MTDPQHNVIMIRVNKLIVLFTESLDEGDVHADVERTLLKSLRETLSYGSMPEALQTELQLRLLAEIGNEECRVLPFL
jgi:hypothetical protein